MSLKYPQLTYWLQAFLHQDFGLVHGSVDDALRNYMKNEVLESQIQMREELAVLLQSQQTEEVLSKWLFDEVQCCYYYPSEWKSAADWLTHVYELLSKES